MATYVYRPGLGLIEISRAAPEAKIHVQTDAGFDNLRAPDGTDLTSRSKWKRYMRENNLTLSADWKETWAAKDKERAAWKTGEGGDHKRRKETLRRVMNEMSRSDIRALGERARERHHKYGKEGLVFRGD